MTDKTPQPVGTAPAEVPAAVPAQKKGDNPLSEASLKAKGNEETTVPASALLALINQTKELTSRLNRIEGTAPPRVASRGGKNKIVEVAMYEDKLVLGWTKKGAYKGPFNQATGQRPMFIDVILEGVKNPKTVLYRDFFRDIEVHPVSVIREVKEEQESLQGSTERKTIGKDGYSTIGTGDMVEMIVTYDDCKFVFNHPTTGKEAIIGDTFVNLRKG